MKLRVRALSVMLIVLLLVSVGALTRSIMMDNALFQVVPNRQGIM